MEKRKVYYVGLDVSKGYADVILLDSFKRPVERSFQIDDNKEGHGKLESYLDQKSKEDYQLICGVENTGGYEQNWVNMLKQLRKENASVEIYKLNPKAVKHQMQSLLKRTVTDAVSAEGIAIYVANNYEQLQPNWYHSTYKEDDTSEAQQFHKMIMGQIKQQTREKNQLEKIIYKSFPELLGYCKNSIPNWMLRLLQKYPTAEAVKRATCKGIAGIKGISTQKAATIKEQAENSVASQSGSLTKMMIKQYSKDILDIHQKIEQQKDDLVRHYNNPDLDILKSINGIADWTATALLIQLGDYKRFTDTNQLAAFYGVNPSFKQSGDGKYRVKMSKQGSPEMRAILYVAANNVVLHDTYFKSIYAHYMSKGKKHRAVIGIIMHKLLRVIYGMLKSQTMFDPKIDEANKVKSEQCNSDQNQISNESRRYQELGTDAPISRSNYKKRRAVLEHQLSDNDKCTVSSQIQP